MEAGPTWGWMKLFAVSASANEVLLEGCELRRMSRLPISPGPWTSFVELHLQQLELSQLGSAQPHECRGWSPTLHRPTSEAAASSEHAMKCRYDPWLIRTFTQANTAGLRETSLRPARGGGGGGGGGGLAGAPTFQNHVCLARPLPLNVWHIFNLDYRSYCGVLLDLFAAFASFP